MQMQIGLILYIEIDDLTAVTKLEIKDNGEGIPYEALTQKFEPFLESEKVASGKLNNNSITTHGKKGVGRLTFFTFSQKAKWFTIYKKKDRLYHARCRSHGWMG